MASLKEMRNSIASVKATQKITKAMQMVAAAKLKRATDAAEGARPYAARMAAVISNLASGVGGSDSAPKLLIGTGSEHRHLVIVATADRGLCGGFNTTIVRLARERINALLGEGKQVSIICVGKKGRDQLKRQFGQYILETFDLSAHKTLSLSVAKPIADAVLALYETGQVDVVTLVHAQFKSVISQVPTAKRLVPAEVSNQAATGAAYDYEPGEEEILETLLPRNITVQILGALLENAAGEQGARMQAMDNATRNAGDMIRKMTIQYNRTRQAVITKELIEIISGAEAL
jgi:F-type H+-transporting ATPase subunit gamma